MLKLFCYFSRSPEYSNTVLRRNPGRPSRYTSTQIQLLYRYFDYSSCVCLLIYMVVFINSNTHTNLYEHDSSSYSHDENFQTYDSWKHMVLCLCFKQVNKKTWYSKKVILNHIVCMSQNFKVDYHKERHLSVIHPHGNTGEIERRRLGYPVFPEHQLLIFLRPSLYDW